MSLTPRTILLLVAVILFLLAAFAGAFLLGDGGLNLRR